MEALAWFCTIFLFCVLRIDDQEDKKIRMKKYGRDDQIFTAKFWLASICSVVIVIYLVQEILFIYKQIQTNKQMHQAVLWI